jgi:hypothetical protein
MSEGLIVFILSIIGVVSTPYSTLINQLTDGGKGSGVFQGVTVNLLMCDR